MNQRVHPENIANQIDVKFESELTISDAFQGIQFYLVGKINLQDLDQEFKDRAAILSQSVCQIKYNVEEKQAKYRYGCLKTYKANEININKSIQCKYEVDNNFLIISLHFNPLFQHFEYRSQNTEDYIDQFLSCSSSFSLILDQKLQLNDFRFRFYTNIKTWEKTSLQIGSNQLVSIKWTLGENKSLDLELKFTEYIHQYQASGILYSRIIVKENEICIAQAHKDLSRATIMVNEQGKVLKFNFSELKDCPPLYFGNHIQSHHIVIITLKSQRRNCLDIFKKNEFTIQVPVDLFPDRQNESIENKNEPQINLQLSKQEGETIRLNLTQMYRFENYFNGIKLLSKEYVDRQKYI